MLLGRHPPAVKMKVRDHQTLAYDMPRGMGIINCDYGATHLLSGEWEEGTRSYYRFP